MISSGPVAAEGFQTTGANSMKSLPHCQCIPAPLLHALFLCCAADVWLLLGSGRDGVCAAGAMTHSGTDELIRAEMKHFPAFTFPSSTFPCLQPSSLCSAASAPHQRIPGNGLSPAPGLVFPSQVPPPSWSVAPESINNARQGRGGRWECGGCLDAAPPVAPGAVAAAGFNYRD